MSGPKLTILLYTCMWCVVKLVGVCTTAACVTLTLTATNGNSVQIHLHFHLHLLPFLLLLSRPSLRPERHLRSPGQQCTYLGRTCAGAQD